MRAALLCVSSAEELFIIEQCRAVCGPPGIAFSRDRSEREAASAAVGVPPSRSDSKSEQHKKSSSGATWIFCMEPFCFGVTRGVQPLVRASRASKVAGAFLVLFWHAKENVPGGNAFYKRHETQSTRKRSAREAPLSGYMPRQLNNFNKK